MSVSSEGNGSGRSGEPQVSEQQPSELWLLIRLFTLLGGLGFILTMCLRGTPAAQVRALEPKERELFLEELGAVHGVGSIEELPPLVFRAEWCPACKALEGDLETLGVQFTPMDLETNPQAGKLFMVLTEANGRGIPQTVVNGQVVTGMLTRRIVELVGEKRLNQPGTLAPTTE